MSSHNLKCDCCIITLGADEMEEASGGWHLSGI